MSRFRPNLAGAMEKLSSRPLAPREVRKDRANKKGMLTQHDAAVIQQVRQLALNHGTTQQKLVAEALNMLFAKYGVAQIA